MRKEIIFRNTIIFSLLLILSGCLTIVIGDSGYTPTDISSQTAAEKPIQQETVDSMHEQAEETVIPEETPAVSFEGKKAVTYTQNYGVPELMQTTAGPLQFESDVIINQCNWNGDELPDLLIAADGRMYILKGYRKSSLETGFRPPEPLFINGFTVSGKPRLGPTLSDLNADGFGDLIINYPSERMTVFYNQGSAAEPVFTDGALLPGIEGDLNFLKKPYGLFTFTDWDSDGDLDLITGSHEGRLTLHKNLGSGSEPRFDTGRSMSSHGGELSLPYRPSPRFYDIDGNGSQDLLFGLNWGNVQAYTRAAGSGKDFDHLLAFRDHNNETLKMKEIIGGNTYPVLIDMNSDGIADLITGSYSGGIYLLKGKAEGVVQELGSSQERFIAGVVASSKKTNTVKFDPLIYELSADELITMFRAYFEDHLWNTNLRWNMRYPAYSWHSNHRNVQAALTVVLPEEIEKLTAGRDAAGIQNELAGRPDLLEHYFSILSYIALGLKSDNNRLTTAEMEQSYQLLASISINSKLGPAWAYPKESFGELNIVRSQLGLTLYSYAGLLNKSSDEITRSLGYYTAGGNDTEAQQLRRDLIRNYDTLILDNGSLSSKHYSKMNEIQAMLPRNLIFPRAIMTFYEYHNLEESPVTVHKVGCVTNVFNVFAASADTPGGNQFNPAYGDVRTARFFSTFMHELNHGVDSEYIKKNQRLNEVKDRLIEEAGSNHENYLRDTFDDGFFAGKPQEFFASISNMYFTSSRDAFQYALDEMQKGDPMPMRQFLFFASVYTEGGICYFYRISTSAEMRRESIPVTIHDNLIYSLTLDGQRYDFSNLWQGF